MGGGGVVNIGAYIQRSNVGKKPVLASLDAQILARPLFWKSFLRGHVPSWFFQAQ